MLKRFRPSKRVLLLSGAIVLLILGVVLIANKAVRDRLPPGSETTKDKSPKIVEVSPPDGAENISVVTPVRIVFDKTISEESVDYTINPDTEITKSVGADSQTVFLSPLPSFEPGTQYTMTITAGSSSYSFSFKTSEQLTESEETALQTEYDVRFNEAADEYERTHPLLELMPVEEDLFKIEYKGGGLYEYTLKGTDKNSAREAVLSWWREHNVDPGKLNLKEHGSN